MGKPLSAGASTQIQGLHDQQTMVYVPPFSLACASWGECAWYASVLLSFTSPLVLHVELSGQNAGYSKFTSRGPDKSAVIPSIAGMFLLYFLPLLVVCAIHFSAPPTSAYGDMVILNMALHFGKRILEVLFVHKYSGGMNMATAIQICLIYCLHSFSNASNVKYGMPEEYKPSTTQVQLGFVTFLVGEFGNFHYHRALANLRAPGEKKYKIPEGGLFEYVCCPHYLFELLAFIGLAIMSNHMVTWCTVVSMGGYLIGRSAATLQWYRERSSLFERELPRSWRAMVPGVW